MIFLPKISNTGQLYFENREMGLQTLHFFVTKGHMIAQQCCAIIESRYELTNESNP